MYFPFLKLHGWGKRFAVQPQTISSELPQNKKPAPSIPRTVLQEPYLIGQKPLRGGAESL